MDYFLKKWERKHDTQNNKEVIEKIAFIFGNNPKGCSLIEIEDIYVNKEEEFDSWYNETIELVNEMITKKENE